MKLYAEELRTFPDPRFSREGVVDLSDDLRVERLLEAYSFGIFPWPHEDLPTLWYSPDPRGILDFADFHVPRRFLKTMRSAPFRLTVNRAFEEVLEACARAPRPGQGGTWITPKLTRAYREFHRAGYAHSLEVWEGGELAGGLYGVYVGGVFSGESMFFRRSGASKFALVRLVEFLRSQGHSWMDIQMVTPLLESFGGRYLPQAQFLAWLEMAKKGAAPLAWETI